MTEEQIHDLEELGIYKAGVNFVREVYKRLNDFYPGTRFTDLLREFDTKLRMLEVISGALELEEHQIVKDKKEEAFTRLLESFKS